MTTISFFYGLAFFGLGLAAVLRFRQGEEFPLSKELPYLAAFGFSTASAGWIDMFLSIGGSDTLSEYLKISRILIQPIIGILLFRFGWGILIELIPLPAWTIFIPGVLIVPIAFIITFALTTFVTTSPLEIPIDIWSRYLLYLPGCILAAIGFLRQWSKQRNLGFNDVSGLMLGAGLAFLVEALVVGLIIPAAPSGPASYYNYDRVAHNAFSGEQAGVLIQPFGLTAWLDYEQVLITTGLPIEFWRMLSAFAVIFFVVRGLDVFDAMNRRQLKELESERDIAKQATYETQTAAKERAESWTQAMAGISHRIVELDPIDSILMYAAESARKLFKSDFVGLALWEDDYTSLKLKCFSTREQTKIIKSAPPVLNSAIREVARNSRQFRSKEGENQGLLKDAIFYLQKEAKSMSAVQLNIDNHPIGVLWIAKFSNDPFTEQDLIWLECMADQVVITIQHGLMTSQLQSLSVSEERARIAREMHDGLSQVLGYLNLQVQTIDALHRKGSRELLQKELRHMREAIHAANADVRENILSLRTTLANEKGLLSAIEEYMQEFGIQSGVNAEVLIKTSKDMNLSSIAEVQLVCILQEALANVRKHAQATHVEVRITKEAEEKGDCVRMQISDDGLGFILSETTRRFGLQTMKERAESVGGALSLHSTLDQGTTIICEFPCLAMEQTPRRSKILVS